MTTLSARYGFKEPRSIAIQRPDDPLYRIFEKWLEGVPERVDYNQHEPHYQSALNLVRKVDGIKTRTANEVQTVLQSYQDDPRIRNAGLFLSACYNTIDQRDLIWDLDIDTRIDWIGYVLGEGKRLVLKTDSGNWIGFNSGGLLLNYADVEGKMSYGAGGSSVNFGSVKLSIAFGAVAPSVNFGSVGWNMSLSTIAPSVNFGSAKLGINSSEGNIQVNIAIKNPDEEFYRNGEICLDEEQAKQHPRLVKYFEDFKAEGKKYRHAGFPECLGVFDVVEQFVGSGTGEELNRQFMEKLRRLLD